MSESKSLRHCWDEPTIHQEFVGLASSNFFFNFSNFLKKNFASCPKKNLLDSGAEHPTKLNSASKLATNHQRDYYYQSPTRSLTPSKSRGCATAAPTQHYATTPTRAPSRGGKKSIPATTPTPTSTPSARQRKQVCVRVRACK